jgi:hypothetical protein
MDMVLYRNGSVEKYVGEQLRFTAYDVGPVSGLRVQAPGAASGSASIYLVAGDYVQLGYDANSGFFGFGVSSVRRLGRRRGLRLPAR